MLVFVLLFYNGYLVRGDKRIRGSDVIANIVVYR